MLDDKTIKIYTDGSANNARHDRRGGYASLIIFPDGSREVVQGHEKNTTSNRMELMAAITSLAAIPAHSLVDVYCDSQYVQRGMEEWIYTWMDNGWKTTAGKPVKNVDLWILLKEVCLAHTVNFVWVKAHSGIEENEQVDRLAKESAGFKF